MMNTTVRLILHSTFLLTGVSGNLYILVLNTMDWIKTRNLSSCTLIISSLGVSNILLQSAVAINELCFIFFQKFYSQNHVINLFAVILVFVFFSGLLFSLCLCLYYFVKIVQFHHPFFMSLKTHIAKYIPWLLGGSVFVSLIFSVPLYWDLYRDSSITTNLSINATPTFNFNFESKCHCIFNVYMSLSSVAFTVFFFLCLTIIASLCKHMKSVKKNLDDTTSLNAHVAAARTLISLLLLYIYLFVAMSYVLNLSVTAGTWLFSFCLLMTSSFPSLNSLVLTMGNVKLRQPLKKICVIKSCTY